MFLHPIDVRAIPEETVRVAQAVFPKGTAYMRMRDVLGPLSADRDFAALFPRRGQPAESPACLALVTIMQFAEGLSDCQAADAVRSRIDWKYALALDLTDPGFAASVLNEFRSRLLSGDATQLLFERMLEQLRGQGLVKPRGRARTDSTHILAAIRTLNRLECVGETLRHTLNTVAAVASGWLQSWVPRDWFERDERRFEEYRLPPGKAERAAFATQIGTDGITLLTALHQPDAPDWLYRVPAVETLRRVWVQQFVVRVDTLEWRSTAELPLSAQLIRSPYDVDARYAKKRQTEWTGYKVPLTETCDPDLPSLIINVETTEATRTEYELTSVVHQHLTQHDCLPSEHLVDTGYLSADQLMRSQKWHEHPGRQGSTLVHFRFSRADGAACPVRARCTRSATLPRSVTIYSQPTYDARQAARQRQHTEAFWQQYAPRSGIEGTMAQGNARADLRHARFIGLAKPYLQHVCTALGLNVLRLGNWFAEAKPHTTQHSAFAAFAPTAA